MDVRDRSTYTPSLETSSIAAPSPVRAEGQSSAAASAHPGQDSSSLSSAARAAAQALALPEVRQDRVSALQSQIANGSYHIAPQEVADAMLRSLQR